MSRAFVFILLTLTSLPQLFGHKAHSRSQIEESKDISNRHAHNHAQHDHPHDQQIESVKKGYSHFNIIPVQFELEKLEYLNLVKAFS
jgi:hypothetical protein